MKEFQWNTFLDYEWHEWVCTAEHTSLRIARAQHLPLRRKNEDSFMSRYLKDSKLLWYYKARYFRVQNRIIYYCLYGIRLWNLQQNIQWVMGYLSCKLPRPPTWFIPGKVVRSGPRRYAHVSITPKLILILPYVFIRVKRSKFAVIYNSSAVWINYIHFLADIEQIINTFQHFFPVGTYGWSK